MRAGDVTPTAANGSRLPPTDGSLAHRLGLEFDRTGKVPLYQQLAEQLERAIDGGDLLPGQRIDNELDLVHDTGLSRPTVRQAIQLLVDKGLLVRKRGVGTQVVHGRIRRHLDLTSLYDDLQGTARKPRSRVLRLEAVLPDANIAGELRISSTDHVWLLERLRFMGDEPLALMQNYLPKDLVDLPSFDLSGGGLYASLRMVGVVPAVARQRISCRRALPSDAVLLGEEVGAPLLTMERTAYDSAGRSVEYGRHAYRPDLYSFDLTVVDR